MTRLIVGVEDSDRSLDAVAFARDLAGPAGARLILATAYHSGLLSHAAHPRLDRRLRERAGDVLERTRAEAGSIEVETRAIADSSPAKALHALAERERASLIVIGSSHRGKVGRVFAGTTAERLLHGSPCPVAVAPKGHHEQAHGVSSILVAYDGSIEARTALQAAMKAGHTLAAAVRVVRVLEPPQFQGPAMAGLGLPAEPEYVITPEEIALEIRGAREAFEADIAALPDHQRLLTEFVVGDPVEELAKRSPSVDLLVTGSRGYGAMRAVLLGSVSERLVREAACPVIVVPREVESHFEDLFVAPSTTRAA